MQLPTTKNWLAIKDAKQRDLAPWTQDMANEVYEYYFRNYAVHFSSEAMSTAFATIPQVHLPRQNLFSLMKPGQICVVCSSLAKCVQPNQTGPDLVSLIKPG